MVVCPEISSPAQSLASVMNPISATSLLLLPPILLSGTFVLVTAWVSPVFFRQQMKASARHMSMMNRPTKKVIMLESKKHHHLRSLRHSSSLSVWLLTEYSSSILLAQWSPAQLIKIISLPLEFSRNWDEYKMAYTHKVPRLSIMIYEMKVDSNCKQTLMVLSNNENFNNFSVSHF